MIRIDPLTIRAVTDGAPVVSRTLTLASPVRAIGGAGKRRESGGEFRETIEIEGDMEVHTFHLEGNIRVSFTRRVSAAGDNGRPGHPHVTRALARRQGYDLVPLPEAAPDDIDPHHHLSALARETGDVMAKLALALADGRLTAHEVRVLKLIPEVEEALQAIVDLRAGLKRLVDST